jgi:hypothetical protein
MPNTQGYEMVAQVKEAILDTILKKAWKSGSDGSDEGVIPQHIQLPEGLAFGPYSLKDGTVQIPQEQLKLKMNPAINGVDITLGTINHIEINDPPIASATFFDINADIKVETPIRVFGDQDVYADFQELTVANVHTTITSGNPIPAITADAIEEFVHNEFSKPGFQKIFDPIPIAFGPLTMDARIELFDDPLDPAKRVSVSFPDADNVQLDVPVYMFFYNISGVPLATPMGVIATARIIAPYSDDTNLISADFNLATVDLVDINPSPIAPEGANYTSNKTLTGFAGIDLDSLIVSGFNTGASLVLKTSLGTIVVDVPQLGEIEAFISAQVLNELLSRKRIFIYRPEAPEDSGQSISSIQTQAKIDFLAIGVNPSNPNNLLAITSFLSGSFDFAIGISKDKIIDELNKVKNETYPKFPHTFDEEIDGKTVKLNRLSFSLKNGCIEISGAVTVVDAILDSIDVDADFDAEVILEWVDNPDGSQTLIPKLKGDPDVDLSLLAWILSFLIGFITFGIVGGIIALVVMAVVENVAESIGASVARDEVSDQLKVLAAWPQSLDDIGEVSARFGNPVPIAPDGIIFNGSMLITSRHELTMLDPADSHGPYAIVGNQLIQFDGGLEKANTQVHWDLADGNSQIIRKPAHRYGKSGLYVTKFQSTVNEEGGVTTRHFAKTEVENTAPVVSLPPNFTIDEGEEFTLKGTFTDENWLDTHTATVFFGDNSKPRDLNVTENHQAPMGNGEVCFSHAYCDNGVYNLRLEVEDDVGSIGTATMQINVENVIPEVFLPDRVYTLIDQPIRLIGEFIDAGWCDSHIGIWDTGDCNKPRRTIISETNQPPASEGIAEIMHIYKTCGRFETHLQIIDDDGGMGEARHIVEVNHIKNADMRLGFREMLIVEGMEAQIANDWYAYYKPAQGRNFAGAFRGVASHIVNDDGHWAQEVNLRGSGVAGIVQKIDVNEGWQYELTACFNFPIMASTAKVRLGIDPLGESDPQAPQIVWVDSKMHFDWQNITVRTQAENKQITLFLGLEQTDDRESIVRWDSAMLYQIQPHHCKSDTPEEKVECLEFSELKENLQITGSFEHKGYLIQTENTGQGMAIATIGESQDIKSLAFTSPLLKVILPNFTKFVLIEMANFDGRAIHISLLRDNSVVSNENEIIHNGMKTLVYRTEEFFNELTIQVPGDVLFESAFLIRVCINEGENNNERKIRADFSS